MNYSSTPSRSEHRQNRATAPTHPASYYSPTCEYSGKEVVDAFRKYNPEATPTGSQYYVKLPDDTDINWAVPLEPEGDSQGIALDRFRKKALKHFNNKTREFVDSLLPSAYREGAPLSLLPSTHMYMMEAVLPNENEHRYTTPTDMSNDPTYTNLLRELLGMQKTWYKFMYKQETTLFQGIDDGAWRAWALNPREDCVRVVAIRLSHHAVRDSQASALSTCIHNPMCPLVMLLPLDSNLAPLMYFMSTKLRNIDIRMMPF
ncbi:uncharacterized protein TRAVEDRAFT_52780 [Trametes versicolor FP-101664 SS1]|uniref:uncharacterized protein n=1 Tax=Trametes versicolor (strain FP-101664) TaxID=717944 RepID=UPI0004621FF4|nr:uncharacterized protein TRAVEDRAFT_52780 [Trametes versicolor FP-101664 SS1]EIW53662.1 hypothetical protein TRAVEDRAFT_52780 [Trametes versicolor FP-101664 SS1]